MIFANTPLQRTYDSFLALPVTVAVGSFAIDKALLLWVNDGLMAIFFLMVGLEIKREIFEGHLSSINQIMLPGLAAIAGITVPAIIYATINRGDAIAISGWAIPSATDIAFAVGIFSLLGSRLPITLKLFLLSVAIFDDIGAIVIIALFYSQDLSTTSLLVAIIGLIGLFVLNRSKVRHISAYMVVGVIVWVSVLKSGVHATLAGFIVAWFIPLKTLNENNKPMGPALEHNLHPWVAFLILPLFAFANAGVTLEGVTKDTLLNPITLGIALGLFFGKQIGIFGICWLAIKCKLTKLPEGATWLQLYGVALLCGVGFTMSLFIGTLAFEAHGLTYQANVKIGVLIGSLVSAILGGTIITLAQPKARHLSPQ
jgi:NhaA family Na+:H+ antiporter